MHYPEAFDEKNIINISRDYFEDCRDENMSAGDFKAAVKEARKTCQFFPKISDILRTHREIVSRPVARKVDGILPQDTATISPESAEFAKKSIALIKGMLSGEIPSEEAQGIVDAHLASRSAA